MPNLPRSSRTAPLRWSPILLLALFTTLLVASAGPRQAEPEESSATLPAITVFLVRHAEKGTDDPRDPSLTDAGKRRAGELARLLSAAKVTHLFSSDYRRTLQTVAPLAEATELEVERYDARALPRLAERLKQLEPGSVAVVAGHSNTTPDLYTALGGGVAAELGSLAVTALGSTIGYARAMPVLIASGLLVSLIATIALPRIIRPADPATLA